MISAYVRGKILVVIGESAMAKDTKIMTTTVLPLTPTTQLHRNPGRPMKIGKFITSTTLPGGIGVYLGRCDACNNKIVFTREQAYNISQMFQHQDTGLRVRLVKLLLGK